MSESASEAEQLMQQYAELWSEQDFSNISDVVSESFVHKTPPAPNGEARGPDGVEEFMRRFTSAFPDFQAEIVDSLSSGDRAAVETKFTMTHEGEFNGIPPTGREVEIQSLAIVQTADGKLQEIREYADRQELLDQLGITEE